MTHRRLYMEFFSNVVGMMLNREKNKGDALSITFEAQVRRDGVPHAAKRIAELTNERIGSRELAKQFVLEELDAARQGDEYAIYYVETCGIDKSEYVGAMQQTSWKGDESQLEHVQLFVRNFTLRLNDRKLMTKLSIAVLDEIMKTWGLGKYGIASQNNAEEQYNLGEMYYLGKGVRQDHQKAFELCSKAAEQGHADAQYTLGLLHERGNGVKQDYNKAVEWYSKAAEQKHAWGQYKLGIMYYHGYGVNNDYNKSFDLFAKAAEQGYSPAQFNLGIMYCNGNGVSKDYKNAAEWLLKSAEQGDANAQYELGRLYTQGNGVNQDYNNAARWLLKAMEQGHEGAKKGLNVMLIDELVTLPDIATELAEFIGNKIHK